MFVNLAGLSKLHILPLQRIKPSDSTSQITSSYASKRVETTPMTMWYLSFSGLDTPDPRLS